MGLVGSGFEIAPVLPEMAEPWAEYSASAQWDGGPLEAAQISGAQALVASGEAVFIFQPDDKLLQIPRSAIAHDHDNGSTIQQGVEFVEGREVAIWIRRDAAAAPERIERNRYMRIWRREHVGQVHGIPWGASVLSASDTLASAEEALTAAIRTSALMGVLLVDENNMGADLPFDGTQRGGIMETGYNPGDMRLLPGGYRPHVVAPQQAQQSAEFLKHELHKIAAGFGVPVHLLSGDMSNANYSSLRAAMVEFNARIEAAQYSIIVPQLLRPIWEAFARREYLAGNVSDLKQAMRCEFIAPARQWVDPTKDSAATAEMLRLGLTSRRRAAAELGWDINRLDEEIASDRERAARRGLTFNEEVANV